MKGEDRNVGRARERAIDERKRKLLQEMQSSKKSNAFVDRRFGETDTTMSLEEKMFARFQQARVKRARNKALYNLDGNDNEVLTHRGAVLGEDNVDADDVGDDLSEDENLGREVVQTLHFGGGMQLKSEGDTEGKQRRSREDTLKEIVMKSKLHKLEKKEAKDAQELDRERLDSAYDELVKGAMLDFKPKRRDRAEDEIQEGKADEFVDYDVALRTMLYEAKVQATDRTKSDEELAAEAKRRLEDLEAARLRRMQRENTEDKEAEEALRGAKRRPRNDDELDEGDEYEGYKSRKDYLLHHDFGADNGARGSVDEKAEDDNGGDADESEDSDGDEDGEEGEEAEDDDEDADEDDIEEEENDDDDDSNDDEQTASDVGSERSGDDGQCKMSLYHKWLSKRRQRIEHELQTSTVNPNMPHNIESPLSLQAFDELVEAYVRNDEDMKALIDRILAWNSVKLPGKEGHGNRGRMHNFLDVLIKHFVRIGDSMVNAANDEKGTKALVISFVAHPKNLTFA